MLKSFLASVCLIAFWPLLLMSAPPPGLEDWPPFVSDRELAEYPIIVVAKWNNAPWSTKSLTAGKPVQIFPHSTEIE
ncbi:MAG: hypothetical protein JWN70_108, partial [Planctomycetaceae bacterium]|nr:hypothetical protein [Planctomycetaceae bacterium]